MLINLTLRLQQRKIIKDIAMLSEKIDNGVLERLYDVVNDEVGDLPQGTPQQLALWTYFRKEILDTYENYKLLKIKGLSAIGDEVLTALQSTAGRKELHALREHFDDRFVDYVKVVNKKQLDDFTRKANFVIAAGENVWMRIVDLMLHTFRANVRSVYSAYLRSVYTDITDSGKDASVAGLSYKELRDLIAELDQKRILTDSPREQVRLEKEIEKLKKEL